MSKDNQNKTEQEKDAMAPYNFVSLPSRKIDRYKGKEELPWHSHYSKEGNLLNGYIEYELKAETPIIVASGKNEERRNDGIKTFFKNLDGKHTIPANTIRGMIRSNAMMLSFSSPADDIQDSLFVYRGLADNSKKLRDDYNLRVGLKSRKAKSGKSYSVVENVKAGYIYKQREQYLIKPAEEIKKKTYHRVNEARLKEYNLTDSKVNYLYKDKECKLPISKYSKHKYEPYSTKISFDLSTNGDNVLVKRIVSEDTTECEYKGFLLCSSYMHNKKVHFVLHTYDSTIDSIELKEDYVRAYKEDLERKKEEREYYKLPEKDGITNGKPIFYAQYNGRIYFGFTPYLRIYYDNSVHAGITSIFNEGLGIDYCQGIFGFSKDKNNYKSRVGFEDAMITTEVKYAQESTVVLSEPKATCFPIYLKQSSKDAKNLVTYNNKEGKLKIRGIKQYWLKEKIYVQKSENNDNVNVTVKPLEQGVEFKGKIHFNNLHEDELGLILWSLKLNTNCYQNIGLGKPYGYGRVKVQNIKVTVEDLEKKYCDGFNFDFYQSNNTEIDFYITKYKQYLKDKFAIDDIENTESVRELMTIKSKVIKEVENDKFKYMDLNRYTKREIMPSISELSKR